MESYRIAIKKSAAKEIEKVEKKDRFRIIEKIRSLASDLHPLGSKKLSGQEKYRIRQGNYRILYQVIDDELIINVVRVGHRRDIYKINVN
ncbi:MAG: mRNA interferase RelE/StbE [Zhongshania aliphaticivorans]|jgi:mRNA interferase RelE/StbE